LHAAPTAFVSRFTATPKDLVCADTVDSVGRSSAARAVMKGAMSRHAAARPRAQRRRARTASIVVVLVVTFMSAPMFVVVTASVVALLVALALFPTLPLNFTFASVILIVTLILGLIFPRSHEVHRPAASIILMTMLAPISCVIWRDMQIDGRGRSVLRLDHHGLCVDDRRRTAVTDIDLTIHAGDDLPGQHDADVHSTCMTCADAGGQYR
jgi:uncharacterized membrane protein YqjE